LTSRGRHSRIRRFRKRISRSRWFIAVLSGGVALVLRIVAATLRMDWTHYAAEKSGGAPGSGIRSDSGGPGRLYAFWHGRSFLLAPLFRDSGVVIITSTSFAGEVLTRVVERFGYHTVRGSSGRRGAAALVAMKTALIEGRDGAVAADGPSGPARHAKAGAVAAARSSGCSVVPVGIGAHPAWTVPHTWDRFMVPLLFARCAVVMGRPIPPAELEGMGLEGLDAAVNAMTDEADRRACR